MLYLYPDGSVTNFRKVDPSQPQRSSLTRIGDRLAVMASVTS
jgi:hypothetical protein